MPLAEKGVRGKGRQPLSPPSAAETRSAISALDQHFAVRADLPVSGWIWCLIFPWSAPSLSFY